MALILLPGLAGSLFIDRGLSAPWRVVAVVLVALQALPLWWRRAHPVAVLAVVASALVVGRLLGLPQSPADGTVIIAVYAVSVYGTSSERLWVVGIAALVTLSSFIITLAGLNSNHASPLTLGPPALVAWLIGDYLRGRRMLYTELLAEHRRETEASRREAAEEERLRIARELHDVVAHSVSLMAIQAGAARMAGQAAGAQELALHSIETTARDVLAELNRILGILRKGPGPPPLSPQPGLGQLDSLLAAARETGLQVDRTTTGEQRPLPAALDLTAYRIAQEAITNAIRHAHASRLEVRVTYLPEALELTIRDNGEGLHEAAIDTSTGHGLIGMRERVTLFGGVLEAGSSSVGGFAIRATLPIP